MNNKTFSEGLCTEPNEQPKPLQFDFSFDEGMSQKRKYEGNCEIKTEPVLTKDGNAKNSYTKSGIEFAQVCVWQTSALRQVWSDWTSLQNVQTTKNRGNGKAVNRGE